MSDPCWLLKITENSQPNNNPFLKNVSPSIMLSPPQSLDEIQPNLVCELLHMNGACNIKHFLVPPPGPGEMSKGQISNYNNKINFKDFIPKIALLSYR